MYKEAYSHDTARSIVLEARGTHFDPDVVDAFVAHEDKFFAIGLSLQDAPQTDAPALAGTLTRERGD